MPCDGTRRHGPRIPIPCGIVFLTSKNKPRYMPGLVNVGGVQRWLFQLNNYYRKWKFPWSGLLIQQSVNFPLRLRQRFAPRGVAT